MVRREQRPRLVTADRLEQGDSDSYDTPRYAISSVAALCNIHPQTIRQYERLGLIHPARSAGNFRLYSRADIEHLQRIQRLVSELGVNLAGVEVILHMRERLLLLHQEVQTLRVTLSRD